MSTYAIVLLVVQHYVFDWLLQPRWMAVNKTKHLGAMFAHGVWVFLGFHATTTFVATCESGGRADGHFTLFCSLLYTLAHVTQDFLIWGTYRPQTENPYAEKAFWDTVAIDQCFHLAVAFMLATAAVMGPIR